MAEMAMPKKNTQRLIVTLGCILAACVLGGYYVVPTYLYQDKYFNCHGFAHIGGISKPPVEFSATVHVHFLFWNGYVDVESQNIFLFTNKHYVCQASDQVIYFNEFSDPKQSNAVCNKVNDSGASFGKFNLVSGRLDLTYGFAAQGTSGTLECKPVVRILE